MPTTMNLTASCLAVAFACMPVLASAQDAHKVVSADAIKWEPAPPVLPKGAVFTVLFGNPSEKGPFALRLKLPDGYQIAPHWHTNAENVTVHSGKFNIGMGEKRDNALAQTVGPGGYFTLPGGMRHFGFVQGETIIDVFSTGPFDITYVDPKDDPSKSQ
jgi:hypothetical protein